MDSGMKYLIESFYRSIREDAPVPIPYREILLTARIMDAIFDQLRTAGRTGPMAPKHSIRWARWSAAERRAVCRDG